jgi:Outer membrane protein beta-barrel domain
MKSRSAITGAVAAVALFAASRPARADISLGGDFDVGLPVGQSGTPTYLSTGAGFDLRFGYRFQIPYQPLFITPQISAGYMDLAAHVIRVRPGVRVSFGRLVIPFAQVHVGYGWASFDPNGTQDTMGTPSVSAGGLAFDVAGGVDFAILRRLHVGAHLGYNITNVSQLSGMTTPFHAKWINVGLGATFFL